MTGADDHQKAERLVKIELDDASGPRRSAEAEQERAIAIYDILEENQFGVPEHEGPFHLIFMFVTPITMLFVLNHHRKFRRLIWDVGLYTMKGLNYCSHGLTGR